VFGTVFLPVLTHTKQLLCSFFLGCWRLEIYCSGAWSNVLMDFSSGFNNWITCVIYSCYS